MKQRLPFKMPIRRRLTESLLTLVIVFTSLSAFAQSTIKGKVTGADDGEGLPGVTILVQGTSQGTITDIDGNYQLKADDNAKLEISFIGYKTQVVNVSGRSTVDVSLEIDVQALDEVIVIGYGEQKKKENTGAVGRIDSEQLVKNATADLGTALQGQIAGVNVQAVSGQPGAGSNIQIRGLSSITGSSQPLYVVDGIPYADDPKLSMNEIETIDILKDAASASIYGTRGSGGVILITTKKGKAGVMKISLDSYAGFQKITSGEPLMNAEEHLYQWFVLQSNLKPDANYQNTWTVLETNPANFTNDTDLRDIIINDNAFQQNHSLTVSGGKEGITFNVVGSFFEQQGSIINSEYKRYNVRANMSYKNNDWTVNSGLGFRIEEQTREPYLFLLDAVKYTPTQTPIDPKASIVQDAGQGNELVALGNLMAKIKQTDVEDGYHLNGFIQASNDLTKDLKFSTRLGTSFTNDIRTIVNPLFVQYDNDGLLVPQSASTRSGIEKRSTSQTSLAWENYLTYTKQFGDHKVTALALYSMEKYTYNYFFALGKDLVSNDVTVLNGTTADANAGSGKYWQQDRTNGLIGTLGRLQYDYKGKYLFSASVRRDGSSRFSDQYRWGVFPSLSAGWNVSDEGFWAPARNAVSTMKVRASYGTTGNQSFLDYSNAATITLNRDYPFGSDDAQINLIYGAIQEAYANADVKWETSESVNLGVDFGFLNDRLTFSADIYNTEKKDMLFPLALPPSTGAGTSGTVILNVGNMTNRGIELASNYRHIIGDLEISLGGTFTRNRNEITKMGGSQDIIYMGGSTVVVGVSGEDNVTALAKGYPAGAFFLIETDGVIDTQEELESYQYIVPTAKMGDLKYVDQDGDSTITINDRKFMGSGAPDWEFGLNTQVDYKGFDFSMSWYGAIGGELMNGSKAYAYKYSRHKDLLYQWSAQNPESTVPANRGGSHENYRGQTDYWLEDGTYVRLRNVAFGYTLPKTLTQSIGISKLRVYISAQNPITITSYTGYNPEVGNDGLSTRGLDRGNYPVSATYRAGIQMEF